MEQKRWGVNPLRPYPYSNQDRRDLLCVESPDRSEFLLVEGEYLRGGIKAHEEAVGSERIHTFYADSYDEAVAKYHEGQGWEPYKPFTVPALPEP